MGLRYAVLRPHVEERQRRLLLVWRLPSWVGVGSRRSRRPLARIRTPSRKRQGHRRQSACRPGRPIRLPGIPYGIDDVSADTGWVSVGTDHDTSAFAVAVATLRTWWDSIGRARYPGADRLLICADGGSNGSRVRAWKIELAAFAADTGQDSHHPRQCPWSRRRRTRSPRRRHQSCWVSEQHQDRFAGDDKWAMVQRRDSA